MLIIEKIIHAMSKRNVLHSTNLYPERFERVFSFSFIMALGDALNR